MAGVRRRNRKTRRRSSCRGEAAALVAIPVFNEVRYVDDILKAVRRYSKNILVVDDGSTDGTSEAVRKHRCVQVIRHAKNSGYGQSLIDTFDFARRHKYDWVISLDCDHQHEPSYIPRFNREIDRDDADIVSGSRYLRKIRSGPVLPPAERVAINTRITAILNENPGLELTDSFCGFKAYRIAGVSRLELTEKGYGFPLQLWVQAGKAGLRIREIPVPLIYHDPRRKFCGVLENAQVRFNYYMEIIERELGGNVCKAAAESFCPQG